MATDLLSSVVAEAVSAAGYRLYAYQVLGQQHARILQVLIEQLAVEDGDQKGILVADCRKVSRQLALALEVAEPPVITGHYHLEVSSPGIERPLFSPEHFSAVQGQRIGLKLHAALPELSGSKKCKAKLTAVEAEHIQLLLDDKTELLITFPQIDKARVVHEIFVKKNNKPHVWSKKKGKKSEKSTAE